MRAPCVRFFYSYPARSRTLPGKKRQGGLALLVRSHICRKYYFFKKFSRRRRVHWLPAPGLPFGSSAGPPPSRSGPCLLWRCRRPGRRRFSSLRALVLLCAPLCGVLYFCRKKQGRRLQKPRAVAQIEKRGRSRSSSFFNLLSLAGNLHGFPSCFNACKGCGKSRAFCSGNSPGCPRFFPSLCEKSAFSFWSAAPLWFPQFVPRLSVSKIKQARPGRCCPCAVASGSVFDVPRRCWLSRLPGYKSAGKIAVFLLGKFPGIIRAAQLLREKPALNFSSVPL